MSLLEVADIAALAFFLIVWVVHSLAANGRLFRRLSLTTAMNAQRERWMRTMAMRELRMIDTSIIIGLQQGTAFFASSSLFAIGGCFALLNATDHVLAVVSDLPFSMSPSRPVFEAKVFGLIVILAYSFFKFGWSYRLFNYCSILIGAVPMVREGLETPVAFEAAVQRAARMNVLAGRHFNAGLRGIFFSLGYLGWFISPVAFALTTAVLLVTLLRRQFYSEARDVVLAGDELDGDGNSSSVRPDNR